MTGERLIELPIDERKNNHFKKLTGVLLVLFTIFLLLWLRKAVPFQSTGKPYSLEKENRLSKLEMLVNVEKDILYSLEGIDRSLLDIYYPKNIQANLPVVLWTHGGGYVAGRKELTQEYGMRIARQGFVVVNIDYALAPGHQYPVPLLQANEALTFIEEKIEGYGGDPQQIFFGGDSAGAQIASQMAAIITNKKLAKSMSIKPAIHPYQLKGVVLFGGLYNMQTVRATKFRNIQLYLASYTGRTDFESYEKIDELSTIKQITSNYPPAFVSAGDGDRLESQSKEFVQALDQRGIAVQELFFDEEEPGLPHQYQFKLSNPYSKKAYKDVVAFLKERSRNSQE